jgi:hypothetical protein
MNIRFISLGFCEMFDFENQTRFCNSNQIKNYFGNTIFHFKINSTKKEDYWAINDQAISHTKLDFHLTPQGGFFDPKSVYTSYYKEKNNTFEDSAIINRQPVFFAVLIPYPILKLFNSGFKNGNEEWGGNSHPFRNQRFSTSLDREKRFSDFRLKTDLESEIKINNVLGRYDHHNDFFRNNCYPLFIENHDELITIVNDLSYFYKRFLEIDLALNNISKIVIPFFELTNEEALGLSKSSPLI